MEEETERYWRGFHRLISKNPEEWLKAVKERKVEATGDDPVPEFYLKCLQCSGAND